MSGRLSAAGTAAVVAVLLPAFGAWLSLAPAASALVHFADDFDPAPNPGWTTTGSGWHVAAGGVDPCYTNPFHNHPPAPASPPNAYGYHFDTAPPAVTGGACTYDLDGGTGSVPNGGRLTSPAFSLTGFAPPIWLHFATWRETEGDPSWDTMLVFYDLGGGPVFLLQVIDLESLQSSWETVDADLSAAAGSASVRLIFEFDTGDEQNNGQAGWYVDDVLVDDLGPPSDVLSVTAVDLAPASAAQGDTDVLFGALDLSTSLASATVDQVRLDLTGAPPSDGDVLRAVLYRDDGDSAFDPAADSAVGSGPFAGNTAVLSVSPPVVVDIAQPERIWVAFDIAPTAAVGDYVGFSVADATYVRVVSPDTTQCLNCPFDTYTPATKTQIAFGGDVVTFTPADLAPAWVTPGQTNVLMGRLDLDVDANAADVLGIDLGLTGTGADGDVGLSFVLLDDGDAAFDGGDALLGSAPFAGGVAAVTFGVPLAVTAGVPELLWVVYSIAPGAAVGALVGLGLAGAASLQVALPDAAACAGCPFDTYVPSGKTEILTTDTLTFTPRDRAPLAVFPGDAERLMLEIGLTVDANTVSTTGIRVDLTGSPPSDADVAAALLWQDDGDGAFEPAGDFLLSTRSFSGNTATFNVAVSVSSLSPKTLWVSFNIASGAVPGHYVGARVADATFLPVAAPDLVACSGCPVDTYSAAAKTEIVAPSDALAVTPASVAPAAADRGSVDVGILEIGLAVNASAATLDAVRVDRTGDGTDADLAAVELWRDDGDGAFEPAADTRLATGMFTSGTTTLPAGITVAAGSPETLFVSFDFAWTATVGAYVGALVADSSYVTVASPDVGLCPSCPVDSYVPAVRTQITAPANYPPAAEDLTVDGFAPLTVGIRRILTANPIFAWGYADPDGDPMADHEVRVSASPGFAGDVWRPGPAGAPGTGVAYGGPALADGTDYYLGVVVSDGVAWSPPPLEARFHTNNPPLPPVLLSPADGDGTVPPVPVILSWAATTDADGDSPLAYGWEISADPLFASTLDGGTTTALTAITPPTAPATTYWWRVRGNDGREDGAFGVPFSFTTVALPPPNSDPQAAAITVSGFPPGSPGIRHLLTPSPVLGWTHVDPDEDPQTWYEVRVGTSSGGSDAWRPGPRPGAATSIVYGGSALVDGASYYFGVRVFDGLNWSLWNETSFHTNAVLSPAAPLTPAPGSTIPAGEGIVVTWTSGGTDPEGDAVAYAWEVDTDPAFPDPLASGTTAATSSAGFPTSPGTIYYWRVRSSDGWEDSPWVGSAFSTAVVLPGNDSPTASFPGVDGFLNGSAGILRIVSDAPAFNWSFTDPDGDPQSSYQAFVSTVPGAIDVWTSGIVLGIATAVAYPGIPALADGADYYLGVRVGDGHLWSPYTVVRFHLNSPPEPPGLLSPSRGLSGVAAGGVNLEWAAAVDADGDPVTYSWEASTSPDFGTVVGSGSGADLTAVMDASQVGTRYFWRVRASDGYADGPFGAPYDFTTADTGAAVGAVIAHVTGPGGAVAGATVRLFRGTTLVSTRTTDAAGNAFFSSLPFGTYTVQAEAARHGNGSEAVEVSPANPNAAVTVTLPAEGRGEEPLEGVLRWMVAATVVVAVVVILLLLVRRRRKPPEVRGEREPRPRDAPEEVPDPGVEEVLEAEGPPDEDADVPPPEEEANAQG